MWTRSGMQSAWRRTRRHGPLAKPAGAWLLRMLQRRARRRSASRSDPRICHVCRSHFDYARWRRCGGSCLHARTYPHHQATELAQHIPYHTTLPDAGARGGGGGGLARAGSAAGAVCMRAQIHITRPLNWLSIYLMTMPDAGACACGGGGGARAGSAAAGAVRTRARPAPPGRRAGRHRGCCTGAAWQSTQEMLKLSQGLQR